MINLFYVLTHVQVEQVKLDMEMVMMMMMMMIMMMMMMMNTYCPRWKCDNSSALWDKDYNASFTYQEIIQLRFSSTPLTSSCWKCHCAYWPEGKDWVWTCDGSYANYPDGGNGGEAGKGWSENTLNPIDNIFTYPTRKCMEATPGPTPQPSDGTPNPTPGPSGPPTTDNTCTNVWDYRIIQKHYIEIMH